MGTTRKKTLREEVLREVKKRYRCEPEYLWSRFPEDAILRHADNRKWFAVIMGVDRSKLGLTGDGEVEVMNVKLDPQMAGLLAGTDGFLPGYHMNKRNWLTILLDGTVDKKRILSLLDISFELTAKRLPRGGGRES